MEEKAMVAGLDAQIEQGETREAELMDELAEVREALRRARRTRNLLAGEGMGGGRPRTSASEKAEETRRYRTYSKQDYAELPSGIADPMLEFVKERGGAVTVLDLVEGGFARHNNEAGHLLRRLAAHGQLKARPRDTVPNNGRKPFQVYRLPGSPRTGARP